MRRTVLLADAASAHFRFPPLRHHKRERPCKDLRGVVLGLCLTYCDVLHCDDRPDRRVCEPLHRLYVKASKGDVPPCEVEEPEPPICGDGAVNQTGEECDDGNNVDCDGCTFDCREEFCGDGTVCAPEECEPGLTCEDGQFCNGDCTCPTTPPPPPPTTCGEAEAPACSGSCPSGRVCVSRDTFCECIGTSE
jgi:cysteine-rich repeat protein